MAHFPVYSQFLCSSELRETDRGLYADAKWLRDLWGGKAPLTGA